MRFHIVIFLASGAVSALSQAAPSNPIVAVTGGKVRGVLLNPQVAVFKADGGQLHQQIKNTDFSESVEQPA